MRRRNRPEVRHCRGDGCQGGELPVALRQYTQADEDALRRELQEAICRSFAVPPRVIGLKRRTRARLWLTRRVDGIGIWLCEHHHEDAAIRLWRIFRLWH